MNLRKNWKKIFVSGLISLSLLLSGLFTLYFALKNNSQQNTNENFNPLNSIKHYYWKGIGIPVYNKSNFKLNKNLISKKYKQLFLLGSIPVKMYKNKNGVYPMTDSQFVIFVDKLHEKLPYGPEIFGLYMININKSSGNFFSPKYKYINLDISSYYERSSKYIGYQKFISFYDKYTSVAVHEYLHYIDYIYAQTYRKNIDESQKLYELGGDTIVTNDTIIKPKIFYVNKKFLTKFKNVLNYNNNNLISPTISSTVSVDRENPTSFIIKGKKYYSVADKYTIKWMWDRVNETPQVNLTPEKGFENYVVGSEKRYNDFLSFNEKNHLVWSKYHYYTYKYSEIFARRYNFLLYKQDPPNRDNSRPWIFDNPSYEIDKNSLRRYERSTIKNDYKWSKLSPESFDSSKSKFDFYNSSLKKQDIWFNDHPYGNDESSNSQSPQYNNFRSTKLYNLLRKLMGQYNGSDISWIIKNKKYKWRNWENVKDGFIVENYIETKWQDVYDKHKQGVEVPQSVWNDILKFYYDIDNIATKSIRMGGYLSKNNLKNDLALFLVDNINPKKGLEVALGELQNDGTIKTLNKKVMIQKYNVKKINSFLDNQYVELPNNSDKYFWVMDDLENVSNIKNLNVENFRDDFKYENDFINISNVKNKKLVLYNKDDFTKFIVLKTTRDEDQDSKDEEFGKTDTLKNESIVSRENYYYAAKEENGFAKIKEYEIA